MRFSAKYPDAEPFQEPMKDIFVVSDWYPCWECGYLTRFIDYQSPKAKGGAPICSEECCATHTLGRSL